MCCFAAAGYKDQSFRAGNEYPVLAEYELLFCKLPVVLINLRFLFLFIFLFFFKRCCTAGPVADAASGTSFPASERKQRTPGGATSRTRPDMDNREN
jgi:hypothetical protein